MRKTAEQKAAAKKSAARSTTTTAKAATPNPPRAPQPEPKRKPATPRLRDLRDKLKALAERGINGERDAAILKLARLESKVDFTGPDTRGPDLFAGAFTPATDQAHPIITFEEKDYDIGNAVKWAIESATQVRCLYHGTELLANATSDTANRLHDIAATISAEFGQLWQQFSQAPGVNPMDRANFILGLYEGMMDEARSGEQLPRRAQPRKAKRGQSKGNEVKKPLPPGTIALHPYTVAVNLGKQIRFSVPITEIAGNLDRDVKAALTV